MQSKFDAQRIVALGAEPATVEVAGNIKFDDLPFETTQDQLLISPSDFLWVAGSTHPGEEEIVLETYRALHKEFPFLRLILAPRHIERVQKVEQLILSHGLKVRMLSYCQREFFKDKVVVLVDVIGQLRYLYKWATVVFIGKSLTAHGGQNMIEPAFYGKPVIVGPHTENFKNVVAEFIEEKAMLQVRNAAELKTQLRRLLLDPALRQSIGQAAKVVVERNKGVTAKTFQIIKPFVSPRSS